MIDKLNKIIFIHIPKTGGESITEMIWGVKLKLKDGKHMTMSDYRQQCNTNDYFCFSFVRNPYTRTQSYYRYLSKHFPNKIDSNFKDWVFDMKGEPKELFYCQKEYVDDSVKIFKYEKFEESMTEISKIINKKINIKIHINKGKKINTNLDSETKNKIYEIYKEDFLKFNYDR